MVTFRKLVLLGIAATVALSIAAGCGKKPLDTPGRQTSDPTMIPPKTKTGAAVGKAAAPATQPDAGDAAGTEETPAETE